MAIDLGARLTLSSPGSVSRFLHDFSKNLHFPASKILPGAARASAFPVQCEIRGNQKSRKSMISPKNRPVIAGPFGGEIVIFVKHEAYPLFLHISCVRGRIVRFLSLVLSDSTGFS